MPQNFSRTSNNAPSAAALRQALGYVPARALALDDGSSGLSLTPGPAGQVLNFDPLAAGYWSSLVGGSPTAPTLITLLNGDTVAVWKAS